MRLQGYFEVLRLTIQFQEYKSKTDFIINHPWRLLLLACFKVVRRFHNLLNRGAINKLTISNKPSGVYIDDSFLNIEEKNDGFRIIIEGVNDSATDVTRNKQSVVLKTTSNNRKVVFIHAFYHEEATYIFNQLSTFLDYDIIISSPHNDIISDAKKIFGSERVIGLVTPNHGRDVIPFLICLKFINIENYTHFIKLHTKKSKHLKDKGRWFRLNVEFLIGNKNITDKIFSLMPDDAPKIFGESVLGIQDHLENNVNWLTFLLDKDPSHVDSKFIPGTMFLGTGSFLRLVKSLNLHRYKIEKEAGQLDGCCVHAMERYFGYLANMHGGNCDALEAFVRDEETVL